MSNNILQLCFAYLQIALQSSLKPIESTKLMNYRTNDVAQACNVTVNTVRNWCKDYSTSLSASATGSEGQRIFSSKDLETFKYIAQLRKEGMQKAAILVRLGETTFPEIDTPSVSTFIAPQTAQDARQDVPASIVGQDYIVSLERRLEAMQASINEVKQAPLPSQRDSTSSFALGFIAALLFVLVIVGLAVLYGGFR